ncbi:nectin-1-like [Pseudophryne corroboree]|uniref:nectin-1-like n=1 Tax=Pseudophryne corroboree TaxID=495146 RepID=UPI003081D1BA
MLRPLPGSLPLLLLLLLLAALPGLQPQVTVNSKVSAWLGSDVTLKCTARTRDTVTQITWQRKIRGKTEDFLTYNEGSEPRRLTPFAQRVKLLSNESVDGSISIQNVTLPDEGTYVCIFTIFPAGATEAEIALQVWVAPAVRVELKPVNASQYPDTVAECLVSSAKPAAMINWNTSGIEYRSAENTTRQSNGTVNSRSELYMTPTPALYGQEVACHVYQPDVTFTEQRNVTVRVTLTNIQYAPLTVRTEVHRSDGGLLQLACQCKAIPPATYMWRRGNESIVAGSIRDFQSGTLNLSEADDADVNGLYICEAANIIGVNIGSVYLYRESRRCRELLLLPFFFLFFIILSIVVGIWLLYRKHARESYETYTEQKFVEGSERLGNRQSREGYRSPDKLQTETEVVSLEEPQMRKEVIRTKTAPPSHGETLAETASKLQ